MDSDDESFYITQDVFRQNVDVDESDIDPHFLDWVDNALQKPHEEEKDKSSANASSNTRKIVVVSDKELKRRREDRIPQKTKLNTAWCLRTWTEWAKERNAVRSSLCVNERYNLYSES